MKEKSLLYRQIHPSFVVHDIVSHQAFIKVASSSFAPTPKDNDKLSVYNGEKFGARDSYEHYAEKHTSYGVLSVTVGEVNTVSPLTVTEDNTPFDGHCYIDFSSVTSNNQKTKKAGQLRDIPVGKGWKYRPKNTAFDN